MFFYTKEENEDDFELVFAIGRIEIAKRIRGMSERDLYRLQLALKSPKTREAYAKMKDESLFELERLYNDLKFRRKYFRLLRRESKENKQKEAISQINKGNSDK